jgi:hypothetical protein
MPFNLKNERDDGYFDENQNFVFKKDVGEVDAWISGLDEQTMEAAIGEAAFAEKIRQAKLDAEEQQQEAKRRSPDELKTELLTLLLPGETIGNCLRRLGGRRNHGQDNIVNKFARRKPSAITDNAPVDGQSEAQTQKVIAKRNKDKIERVTELADLLMASGLSNIYSMSFDAILASTVLWEYQAVDGHIYGPYTSQQIAEWKSQGFLTGPTAVPIRKVSRPQHSNSADSIYDDNDAAVLTDGPDSKRARTDDSAPSPSEGWVSSDEVDFGEHIDLGAQIVDGDDDEAVDEE